MDPDYTLNDLITLADALNIMGFSHHASLAGSESNRPVNLYIIDTIQVVFGESHSGTGRVLTGFPKKQIRALGLLYDLWEFSAEDSKRLEWQKPVQAEDRIAQYKLLLDLPESVIVILVRLLVSVKHSSRSNIFDNVVNSMPEYPDLPIRRYLTRQQLMAQEDISHQTVYNRTDKGIYEFIEWQGYQLWLPLLTDEDSDHR